jgi:hypothetical protein
MFILHGRGAGSKGIPMSKQQHRGHESEVLESGDRQMEETGFMLWQPYFIKKQLLAFCRKSMSPKPFLT